MKISKNEIASALVALGKLVCRTSPVEVYRSLQIESKENQIKFQTVAVGESLTYTIPVEETVEFSVIVNFDEFRTIVRACRNKALTLEYIDGKFSVENCLIHTITADWPEEAQVDNGTASALPKGFVGQLATLAQIIDRKDYRPILQGIHFCKDGMVTTNGKELLHIEMPLAIDDLTIPFPHALIATKSEDCGKVTTWGDREFRFEFGNWCWTGKGLCGSYPNWHRVIPNTIELNHVVNLDADRAAQLAIFLRNVPDDMPQEYWVQLYMGDDHASLDVKVGTMQTSVAAEFPDDWGDFTVSIDRKILLHLLGEGHTRIAFGHSDAPFVAVGGIGRFVAMPLASHKQPVVQPKPKEEVKMNASISNVVAPMQPVAPTITPDSTSVNPLDDLANAVDDFKSRIKAMFDESTLLARKVKEAAIVQKQKEREFIQARRAIERIRMAI